MTISERPPLKAFKKKKYNPGRPRQDGSPTQTLPSRSTSEPRDKELPTVIEPPGFAIPGLSLASAFVLELVQSRVHCIAQTSILSLPYDSALGSNMEVRKGMMGSDVVALKRVRTDVNDYGNALANALFEIRVMAHKPLASHRNIVNLRAVSFADEGAEDDQLHRPCLLKPLIIVDWSLGDLTSHLLRQKLDFTASAELVADIADGLQMLHLYGITHADLKPDNVLLFSDPATHSGFVARLADFGYSGSEEHRQARKGLTSRWAAPSANGNDDYIMKNGECPGDVFSFGLVAMFVAIAAEWDPEVHLPDSISTEVQLRRFDEALERLHAANECQRWQTILHSTIIPVPHDRLTTQGLGEVRATLFGHDRFESERKLSMIHMIPFRGIKGAQNTYRAELEFSKMSWDFGPQAKKTWRTLPTWMKNAIHQDFDSFDIKPIDFYKNIDDDLAIRVVAVALLGVILLSTVPAFPLIRRCIALAYMAWRVHEAGTRLGIEDLEDRSPVWRLAAMNKIQEALDELRKDPKQLTYKHRGHTIVHYAALYGKPKLLAGILEMAPEAVEFVTARGFTPLLYAAATSDRRGEECLDILLEYGASVRHVSPNGESLLIFLYMCYMQSGPWSPISMNLERLGWWSAKLVCSVIQKMENRMGRSEEEMREATRKNDELLPSFGMLDHWDRTRASTLERRDMILNHYGTQHSDALLHKIERIRKETGPCDDMLTLSAGLIPTLEWTAFLWNCSVMMFCVAVTLTTWVILIVSSFQKSAVVRTAISLYALLQILTCARTCITRNDYGIVTTSFNNMTGNLAETPLLEVLTGVFDTSYQVALCLIFSLIHMLGTVLTDFLMSESVICTLAPVCLVVSLHRTQRRKERQDRELEWIQRAMNIDGDIHGTFSASREAVLESTQFKVINSFTQKMFQGWRTYAEEG